MSRINYRREVTGVLESFGYLRQPQNPRVFVVPYRSFPVTRH